MDNAGITDFKLEYWYGGKIQGMTKGTAKIDIKPTENVIKKLQNMVLIK